MLRQTLLQRRGAYNNRTPHLPINYKRARWNDLMGACVSYTATSHKDNPEDWKETWNQRRGADWHSRINRRREFVGWPWISFKTDPVRQHKTVKSRTLNAQLAACGNVGFPQYDHYAETAKDYRLPNNADTKATLPHLLVHVGMTWPHKDIVSYVDSISVAFSTVQHIAQKPDALREWRERSNSGGLVPAGFVEHMILLCRDVMRNNSKKAYRNKLQQRGFLRTNEMTRYYALPYVRSGSAMPQKLEQDAGKEYVGPYLWLMPGSSFHPLFSSVLQNPRRKGFYNA